MVKNFRQVVPAGDTRERAVCETCGFVDYENPRIVAGALVVHEGQVLLCRRDIEPRRGCWTLPAGFLEAHEAPEEGARREVREEACAEIELEALLGLYTVRRLSQVQMFYRARFAGAPGFAAGEETAEARLFAWEQIPWAEIAFPSVTWALNFWHEGAAGMTDLGRFSTAV
jgi:ADP-ribose pyrophosphatase YjhB (NUDIX family)